MLLQAVSNREFLFRFVPLGFWTAASIGLGNIGSLYLDMGLVGALVLLSWLVPALVHIIAALTAPSPDIMRSRAPE